MKARLAAAAVVLLALSGRAAAHRLDEYLQATVFSIEKDRLVASMRMVPPAAASSALLATMDRDADGIISPAERLAYGEQVMGDLSLSVDGVRVPLRLLSIDFPEIDAMKAGLGEIRLELAAEVPGGGPRRRVVFENRHQPAISVYLANCLVPGDPDIRVIAQTRDERQSFYQLDYEVAGGRARAVSGGWWPTVRDRAAATGFARLFRLGMHHIAEGTDHLLFLLSLLLPAPLIAVGSRWAGIVGLRRSLLTIVTVVSAFTVGHAVSLALAASGAVMMPARPVEVLIAVSILVSSVHAIRPIFPGREAAVAASFGVIHGLAFARTLGLLELGRWERLSGILAFNLGIEAMQLMVVAAALPAIIVTSRTRAYPMFRMCGALFAAVASAGWIAERLLGMPGSVDVAVNAVAHRATSIAVGLTLVGLVALALRGASDRSPRSPGRVQSPDGSLNGSMVMRS